MADLFIRGESERAIHGEGKTFSFLFLLRASPHRATFPDAYAGKEGQKCFLAWQVGRAWHRRNNTQNLKSFAPVPYFGCPKKFRVFGLSLPEIREYSWERLQSSGQFLRARFFPWEKVIKWNSNAIMLCTDGNVDKA